MMGSPFDEALERLELARAANAYASARGTPDDREYWAAWLRFRHNVKTTEDLTRVRARAAQRREPAGHASRAA
jgi:hypothetical protein